MTLPARTFGIELEVFLPRGMNHQGMAEALQEAGIRAYAAGYTHEISSSWKIVTDGSLGDYGRGAEIVSPILSGEEGIAQARTVCEVLTAKRCTVNKKCGFHLHVGAGDLSPLNLANIAANYLWFETWFDYIVPPSRRGSLSQYVKSNRARFGGTYGTAALNEGVTQLYRDTSTKAAVIRTMHGGSEWSGGDRYYKLNMTALLRQPTIEFRQHSGTIEADKVEHWVRLMLAFVETAKDSRRRTRRYERDLTPAEECHWMWRTFPLVPEATRQFYVARRRHFERVAREEEAQRPQEDRDAIERLGRPLLAELEARLARTPQRHTRVRYSLRNAIERVTGRIQNGASADTFRHLRRSYVADGLLTEVTEAAA